MRLNNLTRYTLRTTITAKKATNAAFTTQKVVIRAMASARVVATGIDVVSPSIGLTADQAEFYSVARRFADEELRPFAAKWDEDSHMSMEALRKCAGLGFAGRG